MIIAPEIWRLRLKSRLYTNPELTTVSYPSG